MSYDPGIIAAVKGEDNVVRIAIIKYHRIPSNAVRNNTIKYLSTTISPY